MLVWLVVAVVRLFFVGFASGNCVVCVYIFRTDDTLDFGLFALGPCWSALSIVSMFDNFLS